MARARDAERVAKQREEWKALFLSGDRIWAILLARDYLLKQYEWPPGSQRVVAGYDKTVLLGFGAERMEIGLDANLYVEDSQIE